MGGNKQLTDSAGKGEGGRDALARKLGEKMDLGSSVQTAATASALGEYHQFV